MKYLIKKCIYTLLILIFVVPSFSEEVPANTKFILNIKHIDRPIGLSGRLDDPRWRQAVPIEINYEITPGENTQASQSTEVYALIDDEHIYFGFNCYDSEPGQIRANLSDRDRIFQDDYVIIALDTYGDYQKAYEFAVNPFGVQGDLLASGNNEDINFNAIWESAAAINESGWTAEMKIPLKSIRFPNKETQNWAINIIRTLPRSSRIQVSWIPFDRSIPGILTQAGRIDGVRNIQSSGGLELLPYAIGQQNGYLRDMGNPESGMKNDNIKGRFGLGFRYMPSSNFSLDAVLNPDFSQIESDAARISVNTTFAIFYPEKRPFFLQGRELLQTPIYYSRSINDPLTAGRIIGKNGALSYMLLSAYDRNTVLMIPGQEESNTVASSLKSMANIGRLRYDLGDGSYVGGMMLARNISDAHNYVLGFDWNYKFWKNWLFNGEAFLSETRELDDPELFGSEREFGNSGKTAAFNGEEYSGSGIHLILSRNGRNYGFMALYNDFTPTFQSYNGLLSNVDFREYMIHNTYTFYLTNSFIERGTIQLTNRSRYSREGMKREDIMRPGLSLMLKGQTRINLSYLLRNDERFRNVYFKDICRVNFRINSSPISMLSFGFSADFGKFIYRINSPLTGKGFNLNANIQIMPRSNINFQLSFSRARLVDNVSDDLFYDGNIYRGVAIYQFSAKAFFRTIVEYNSFARSWNIYPLFNYKASAFTTFYAGVSNDIMNYGDPFGLRTTNRQFFVKMQYLIQK
ncbi:carbohydrate binding family 9 domain-containing protein [bacterium]|nr:carbohydrate binding family 9 domain-containing protein [bacterium]